MPEGGAGFSKRSNVIPLWGETSGDEKREPPHNIEAEHALLGALLSRNDLLEKAAEKLRPEHFYNPLNSRLYGEIARVILSGRRADPVTLQGWISADVDGKAAGGHRYLSSLIPATKSFEVGSYADLIREMWIRREAIAAAGRLVEIAHDVGSDIVPAFTSLANHVDSALCDDDTVVVCSFDDALDNAIAQSDEAAARGGTPSLPLTRFPRLNGRILLAPKQLTIVGGESGEGKSALAFGWMVDIARDLKARADKGERVGGVVIVSLEMSEASIANRAISACCGVPADKIERGALSEFEKQARDDGWKELRGLPLKIVAGGGLGIASIKMRCTQAIRSLPFAKKPEIVCVDHLQLVETDGHDSEGAWATNRIARDVLKLCKTLGCPIVALSQITAPEDDKRTPDWRPKGNNLRWSKAFRQNADSILILYRPEKHLAKNEPTQNEDEPEDAHARRVQQWREMKQRWHRKAELIGEKLRHGQDGWVIKLLFDAPTTTFTEDPEQDNE